ncbi:hypothetical protein F5B19DRAFT_444641 [Rostrohypoxylon terebratum]|nr:hypothetical protein F5B19DRAFT_444641 [Rostrohypoxylon terebratum]
MDSLNSGPLNYPTFPRFRDLPFELRCQIYELTFPRRILIFREEELIDHVRLAIYPLGPPVIAQTCREAWEFAKLKYRIIPYHAAKLRLISVDSPPATPPTPTWFNPAVDAIFADFDRLSILKDHNAVYNPQRIMYPDGDEEAWKRQDATYSEIVRSLLPFAKLVETVIIRTSYLDQVEAHEFIPFADSETFPRIKTVLISVSEYIWDVSSPQRPEESDQDIRRQLQSLDPLPQWSVRLFTSKNFEPNEKIEAEFGNLNLIKSKVLITENESFMGTSYETPFEVCGGDGKSPFDSSVEFSPWAPLLRGCIYSSFTRTTLRYNIPDTWMTAGWYLRGCFQVSAAGDRVYSRYDIEQSGITPTQSSAEISRLKNNGPLPQFRPIAMISRRPMDNFLE